MRRILLCAVGLVATAAACRSTQSASPGAGVATVAMRNRQSESVGDLRIERAADGVRITGELLNLPPGTHGIHFHAVGLCDDATFEAAGPHFNPGDRQHGLENPEGPHAGDLPEVIVPAAGRVAVALTSTRATLDSGATSLFDVDGSALVVHADADDQRTDPAGNSGERIACGVVMRG